MPGFDARAARVTWTAAVVLLLLYGAYQIRSAVLVFIIALMFAYLLYPLFNWLQSKAHARASAVTATFVIVIGLIAGMGAFIGSHVADDARKLTEQLRAPGLQQQLAGWHVFNIPVGAQITSHYSEIVAKIPTLTFQVIAAFSNLIYLVIIPILSFFLLKDAREIRKSLLDLFPRYRSTMESLLEDGHILMLQYMRTLLLLCLATLAVFSIVLSVMQVPYALLLASVAFVLEFIPLMGPLSAGAIIIAVSFFAGYGHVLWLIAFLGVYRLFQDYILSPHLMKKGVELHPLAVIFGVFAGGEIGGVAGIFLSVPILALLRLVYYRTTSLLD